MLLLQIQKNLINKKKFFKILHLKKVILMIKKRIKSTKILKKTKEKKILRININLNRNINDDSSTFMYDSEKLIHFIIGITAQKINTIVYLSDIKGTIKLYCTTGSLRVKKKQRKKKVPTLVRLFNYIVPKMSKIINKRNVALHLNNISEKHGSFAISYLKKHFDLQFIKLRNDTPHNGCRPRKLNFKKNRRIVHYKDTEISDPQKKSGIFYEDHF
jgi:ribosomal protein S11